MPRVYHGVIHGKTIEVSEDIGLAEGQEVEITVRTIPLVQQRQPGEGLLRTEGALADDAHWDALMEEIHQARKQERRNVVEEP